MLPYLPIKKKLGHGDQFPRPNGKKLARVHLPQFIQLLKKGGILGGPPTCGFLLKIEEFLRKSMDFQEESKAGGLPRLRILQNPGIFLPTSFKKVPRSPENLISGSPGPSPARSERPRLARAGPGPPENRPGLEKSKKSNFWKFLRRHQICMVWSSLIPKTAKIFGFRQLSSSEQRF